MPYSNEIIERKRAEKEAKAYKIFLRVAKKICKIEYGVWTLVPDPTDPLTKCVLSRDIGLVSIHLSLHMQEYYHNWSSAYNSWEERKDWRPTLQIVGLNQKSRYDDGVIRTGVRVGPRAAKKVLEFINTRVIPGFYQDIEREKETHDKQRQLVEAFRRNVAKVPGLIVGDANGYSGMPSGTLKNCPLPLELASEGVRISGRISYDDLAEMAKTMGWGK